MPISSLTFVLRGRGKKKVLKLRPVGYLLPREDERNTWGVMKGIVAVLDVGKGRKEKEVPIAPVEDRSILEIDARPGREFVDIKRYMRRVFGDVPVEIRGGPKGYHVVLHLPEDHPLIRGVLEVVEKEGEPPTYGVHAIMNPNIPPLGWAHYVLKRFETPDIAPKDLLKYARTPEDAELLLKRVHAAARALEDVLRYLKTARALVESAGTGAAIRYLRQIRDKKLVREEDHVLALVLDNVLRVITRHPRPEKGLYPQKARSRKWALRVLKREIGRLALVKGNMDSFLESIGLDFPKS